MNKEKFAVWASGDTQNAIEVVLSHDEILDYDKFASQLDCEAAEVNMCRESEMLAYGVAYASAVFQAPKSLAN